MYISDDPEANVVIDQISKRADEAEKSSRAWAKRAQQLEEELRNLKNQNNPQSSIDIVFDHFKTRSESDLEVEESIDHITLLSNSLAREMKANQDLKNSLYEFEDKNKELSEKIEEYESTIYSLGNEYTSMMEFFEKIQASKFFPYLKKEIMEPEFEIENESES